MSTPIGPYGADRQLATYPYGELWEATSDDGRVLLLILNADVENAASTAETAVARASEIRSDGAVAWAANGVAEDGRAFLAAPLGDSTSFAHVAKQSSFKRLRYFYNRELSYFGASRSLVATAFRSF